MPDPFVAVGGDAAGLSAASKLRREDPTRVAIVFEKGEWVSYAHCGTPYYVEGSVAKLTDLLALRPDDVEERGIDLRRNHEVIDVAPDDRVVTVETDGETFEQPYAELLVATGARAARPAFDGMDLDGAFALHGLDDAAAIRAFLADPDGFDPDAVDGEYVDRDRVSREAAFDPPESVAVVGGGYVGVEMTEALAAHDVDVALLQRSSGLLAPFGEAVGDRVADHLRERGVDVRTGATVTGLEDDGTGRVGAVEFERDGASATLDADMAVVGVGVRPNTDLLDGSGVALGDSGAVATDRYGRTSVADVFAAGDCAESYHVVTGDPDWVPLGLTANRAGRAVGQTVAGDPTPTGEIAGTAAVKAFDLECGRTGVLDHDRAREAGFDPVSETVTAGSRSGYYPGAAETTVTLAADRGSGRLLGGSVVGADRAAVRIDTVATALQGGLTAADLEDADLAYAPPFSPVWDPVLVAAKVLNGTLDG